MKILVIGSGGREHSLVWAFSQNPKCQEIHCIPGNAGIKKLAICKDLNILDNDLIISYCKLNKIDFVVVGPEAPLANGLINSLNKNNILSFGPTKEAAFLESSKSFTKSICDIKNIPTANYILATSKEDALNFIEKFVPPFVIKLDGLAAGKGVFILNKKSEAIEIIKNIYLNQNKKITLLIEEFLVGNEASLFVICNGKNFKLLGSAQDYKKIYDKDLGANTGGMGAFSPALNISPEVEKEILDKIVTPTLIEMDERGTPFSGILYAGLMITHKGPKLIEYNVRLGDPECQVIAIRLGAQLLDALFYCSTNEFSKIKINYADDFGVTVVMASGGYPNKYETGFKIKGIEKFNNSTDVEIFHSGTKCIDENIVTNGGRVLSVTSRSSNLNDARKKTYEVVDKINWENEFHRKDIAKKYTHSFE